MSIINENIGGFVDWEFISLVVLWLRNEKMYLYWFSVWNVFWLHIQYRPAMVWHNGKRPKWDMASHMSQEATQWHGMRLPRTYIDIVLYLAEITLPTSTFWWHSWQYFMYHAVFSPLSFVKIVRCDFAMFSVPLSVALFLSLMRFTLFFVTPCKL